MSAFETGQRVKIPVHLVGGPFPDQVLAMIRFNGKDVSGVLSLSEIVDRQGTSGFVRAEVLEVAGAKVKLAVPKGLSAGTFSRSGKATLPLDWAEANLVADTDGR